MVVCNFFLQGRCRYGEKCWNEHPRGGNRGGYNDNYNRAPDQQQSRRQGGGFGNRVWVNPSQPRGGYIQPSSFSQERDDWGFRGGGGRRENPKSSEFLFSNQNRFSAFNSSNTFDRGGRGVGGGREEGGGGRRAGDEDEDKKLEMIQTDMGVWESSKHWGFSCYSCAKASISGFTDLSPEELRLEYYTARASGDLQSYLNGVNQLLSQWKSRVQELKVMSPATRLALLAELNGSAPQPSSSGFGSATSTGFGFPMSSFENKGFGAPPPPQASSFSFTAPTSGFGSSAAPLSSSTGFGGTLPAPTQPPSGFGSSSTPSASTFSFAPQTTTKSEDSSGSGSASGFSFSAANAGGGFGERPAAGGSSSGGVGAPAPEAGSAPAMPSDSLFSPESNLTEEELNQFKAKKFTLGQIPLKPPPANMLLV
uniref:Nucleoporin NUP42 n=1 Tax=Nothobranchius rachovii TaxID=451742 RepID=A0A1A8RYX4_9TELE